ncbi:MAG: hypothetical protein LBQ70_03495, partial [Prevotellaceae bacterium]|jgi:hypothetical protein|nr:hypothetical protein [Prevotellaceae bacterium]
MIAVFYAVDAQSQTSKVEEFINKYSEQEGATYVELSKTMLDATFNNDAYKFDIYAMGFTTIVTEKTEKLTADGRIDSLFTPVITTIPTTVQKSGTSNTGDKKNYPQKLKSLILNDNSKVAELKQALNGYEILMTSKKGKVTEATYFHDPGTADKKEIVIMKHQEKQLSVTYMQGNLDVRLLQLYLTYMKIKLSQLGMVDMFHY